MSIIESGKGRKDMGGWEIEEGGAEEASLRGVGIEKFLFWSSAVGAEGQSFHD